MRIVALGTLASLPVFSLLAACSGGPVTVSIPDSTPVEAPPAATSPAEAASETPSPATEAPAPAATAPAPAVVPSTYYASCMMVFSVEDMTKTLSFYTEVSADDASNLAMTMSAMKPAPATVSRGEGLGRTIAFTGAVVGKDGSFGGSPGDVVVPGLANPVSGRDIDIAKLVIRGRYAPGAKFCASMEGHVTAPQDFSLDAPENTCLFIPVKEGDKTPVLVANDFADGCR